MVEEISFERVHRKYAEKTSTRDIQRFEANNYKVLFLPTKKSRSACRYVRNLKGTNFRLANDYPKMRNR